MLIKICLDLSRASGDESCLQRLYQRFSGLYAEARAIKATTQVTIVGELRRRGSVIHAL